MKIPNYFVTYSKNSSEVKNVFHHWTRMSKKMTFFPPLKQCCFCLRWLLISTLFFYRFCSNFLINKKMLRSRIKDNNNVRKKYQITDPSVLWMQYNCTQVALGHLDNISKNITARDISFERSEFNLVYKILVNYLRRFKL